MIVEQRTYTLYPGKVPEFVRLYETEGFAIQTRILPRLVGWFYSEIGELNQIVHMWGYDDLNQRTEKRKLLWEDAGWLAYAAKVQPLLMRMESKILIPASFSPIR